MYIAPARPFSPMPASRRAALAHSPSGLTSTANVASVARPMTTTLAMVPSPGHWRRGAQRSRTSAPTTMTTVPKLHGTWRATPKWNTSQGSRPRPARIIIAMEAP